jgi:hypothetical protein
MRKIILMIATAAALAATASAPADAHRLRVIRPGGAIAAVAGAAVAAATIPLVAAEALDGPGVYYGPTPLYYGAPPVILPYPIHRHHWW